MSARMPSRCRLTLALALAAVLWPEMARAGEPPSTVAASVALGISASDETAAYPEVRVESDFPLGRGVRGRAVLEFTGLPGETLDLRDPTTFRAAGATVALSLAAKDTVGADPLNTVRFVQQRIAIELVGATWTRLVTRDAHPRDRFVSEGSVRLRVERRSLAGDVERYVSVGAGHCGIAYAADRGFHPALILEGRARVVSVLGTALEIGARVDKALFAGLAGRDRFSVSVGAAW